MVKQKIQCAINVMSQKASLFHFIKTEGCRTESSFKKENKNTLYHWHKGQCRLKIVSLRLDR